MQRSRPLHLHALHGGERRRDLLGRFVVEFAQVDLDGAGHGGYRDVVRRTLERGFRRRCRFAAWCETRQETTIEKGIAIQTNSAPTRGYSAARVSPTAANSGTTPSGNSRMNTRTMSRLSVAYWRG